MMTFESIDIFSVQVYTSSDDTGYGSGSPPERLKCLAVAALLNAAGQADPADFVAHYSRPM